MIETIENYFDALKDWNLMVAGEQDCEEFGKALEGMPEAYYRGFAYEYEKEQQEGRV